MNIRMTNKVNPGQCVTIDLTEEDTDIGIGFSGPLDGNAFVVRVAECRLLLNEVQAVTLQRAFARYPETNRGLPGSFELFGG